MSKSILIATLALATAAFAQAPMPVPLNLPADAMTNPAALPGMLGVPYTLTDDGRCSWTVVNGIHVKFCIAPPPAGVPTGPGNTPPPAPPEPDVALEPVTVKSGDTLGEIARDAIQLAIRMGLISPPGPSLWGPGGLVDVLARHNSIENPNLIFPGQVIDVSIDELGAAPAPHRPQGPPPIALPPIPQGDPSANTSFPPFALGPNGLPLAPGLPPPPMLPPALPMHGE